jgi:hypothetical protein
MVKLKIKLLILRMTFDLSSHAQDFKSMDYGNSLFKRLSLEKHTLNIEVGLKWNKF